MEAVGPRERGEHVVGTDGTSEYCGAGEFLQRGLEPEAEGGQGGGRV